MPAAPDTSWIEYAVVGGYLFVLVAIGLVFRHFNRDVSDYFRNGCKGTWWLVGASAFMTMFSAFTFTGAAGAAFESGFGVTIIFIGNALGFFLVFAFLGPWYRQMRTITAPEAIRQRYGPATQQFYAWFQMITGVLYAAGWLVGLAIFTSAVFGYDLPTVVWVTGLVVLLYSVFGGSWAVMATDFLQFLILIPLTLLVAVLALGEVGGVTGFFETIKAQGLTEQFKLVNDPAVRFAGDEKKIALAQYGLAFAVATLAWKAMLNMSVTAAPRYFAAKTGREARLAGLLACGMMVLGMTIWFIPPMVARMIMADEVLAQQVSKPAETSYALLAMRVLPTGLTGLMVVAMFAATMSSMDSGLNRNAAVFIRDVIPPVRHLFGARDLDDKTMFRLSQYFSVLFGILIISAALYLASLQTGKGLFEYVLNVGALLGAPMIIPMLLALFIKRAPRWSAIATVSAALVPSALAFYGGKDVVGPLAESLGGVRETLASVIGGAWAAKLTLLEAWTYQDKIFANSSVGVLAFLATMPFWKTQPAAYQAQVERFFEQMHRPVDFKTEVGEHNDPSQLKIIGGFSAVVGGAICLLALIPQDAWSDHVAIVFVGGFVAVVGLALGYAGKRSELKRGRASAPAPETPAVDDVGLVASAPAKS